MQQRYSTFFPPLFALVFVGTLFSLFWGYSAAKESSLRVQKKHFQSLTPDKPEYRAFYNNYQSFYGQGKKEEYRERLRQIQQRLESDPQSYILKKELATYHAWLKTIQGEKARIDRTKTIDERLEVIRAIKENQDRIQGIPERKSTKTDTETVNLYPTIYELADYLEYLELHHPARWETLLGHTPGNFLYQLGKDYHAQE